MSYIVRGPGVLQRTGPGRRNNDQGHLPHLRRAASGTGRACSGAPRRGPGSIPPARPARTSRELGRALPGPCGAPGRVIIAYVTTVVNRDVTGPDNATSLPASL